MSTMLVGKKVFTVTSTSTSSSISREETLAKDMFEAVKKRNITGDQADVDGILDVGKVNLGTFVYPEWGHNLAIRGAHTKHHGPTWSCCTMLLWHILNTIGQVPVILPIFG